MFWSVHGGTPASGTAGNPDTHRECPAAFLECYHHSQLPARMKACSREYSPAIRISYTIPGEPIGKPQMTQSDRRKKRDCVERFRAWADASRLAATGSPLRQIQDETVIGLYAFFRSEERRVGKEGRA